MGMKLCFHTFTHLFQSGRVSKQTFIDIPLLWGIWTES